MRHLPILALPILTLTACGSGTPTTGSSSSGGTGSTSAGTSGSSGTSGSTGGAVECIPDGGPAPTRTVIGNCAGRTFAPDEAPNVLAEYGATLPAFTGGLDGGLLSPGTYHLTRAQYVQATPPSPAYTVVRETLFVNDVQIGAASGYNCEAPRQWVAQYAVRNQPANPDCPGAEFHAEPICGEFTGVFGADCYTVFDGGFTVGAPGQQALTYTLVR